MDASQLAWLSRYHPTLYLLITLLPVLGMFFVHGLHSVIRLYFEYKRQKLQFDYEMKNVGSTKEYKAQDNNDKRNSKVQDNKNIE